MHVDDDRVRVDLGHELDGLLPRVGLQDHVPLRSQNALDGTGGPLLVIDEEHEGGELRGVVHSAHTWGKPATPGVASGPYGCKKCAHARVHRTFEAPGG